jgi:hypothetical protein
MGAEIDDNDEGSVVMCAGCEIIERSLEQLIM